MIQLPQQSPSRLLDPFFFDVLMARILPRLPPAAMGTLHGACVFLRDLLDSQQSSPIWSAIASKLHLEKQFIECPHLQEGPLIAPTNIYECCSQCFQAPLRGWAQAIQGQRAGGGQIQGREHAENKVIPGGIRSVCWSPCSCWVAVTQAKEAAAVPSYDIPGTDEQYHQLDSSVTVADSQDVYETLTCSSRRPASQNGCHSMGWRVMDLQWLPATADQGQPMAGLHNSLTHPWWSVQMRTDLL